ncbi:MAG: phosphatase PAP2 family protein [Telluria sp.]
MHLGDITLTLPAAVGLAAWLLACRAWRSAACWSLCYALAVVLVGASKIAFLGWGTGVPALGFKAISGHATGATALFPTLFYVLVHDHEPALRRAAAGVGLLLGALVAVMLVTAGEHTVAEAAAGWAIGAAVSLTAIRYARVQPFPRSLEGLGYAVAAFIGAAWVMKWAPLGYWMARAALALSGNGRLHSWDSCG